MLYFICHTEWVCLAERFRGTRKSEQKKKMSVRATISLVR